MSSNQSSPKLKLCSPKKSEIIPIGKDAYRIVNEELSSIVLKKPNLIEIQIICGTFIFELYPVIQFKGTKLAIYANNIVVRQSCKIDLSGVPHKPFIDDAGQNSDGRGKDGLNGSAGDSGGNFVLISKRFFFENDSTLTIISNGADGMNGQNGGNGDNGRNGKDATEHSFKVKGFDWSMYSPLCAENREMYEKFGLQISQKSTSHSNFVTDEGLFGHVFVQLYDNEEYGLILIKGEELGFPGKLGGRGGLGGQGGLAGNILIKIGQDEHHENITVIKNPGKAGQDGIGGLNGSKGRIGGDFYKFHSTTLQDPICFGQHALTKFKFEWGESRDYSLYDTEKGQYVYAVEDYKIAEQSPVKARNNEKKTEKTKEKPYQKPSIDTRDIEAEYSQHLQYLESSSFTKKILQPVNNLLLKINL